MTGHGAARGAVVDELARRLGSSREARWVVDEALASRPEDGEQYGDELGGRPVGRVLTVAQRCRADELARRRLDGEPLQYVLGHWPFRHLELTVDHRALIPRPETEELVDEALAGAARRDLEGRSMVAVDLGTGSGAVGLSLATELAMGTEGVVWGVDDDPEALALAGENRARLAARDRGAADRLRLARGSWWTALPPDLRGRVDLAVSNPPYVSAAEWPELDPVVRDHEPRHALVSGEGPDGTPGLAAVNEILLAAPEWLSPRGVIVLELAPAQAEAARTLAERAGLLSPTVSTDLSGRPRFLRARGAGNSR